ncbi:MAG: tRNA1(Val) (adenine(37)-N6)-methyltransferase [Lachnospiraceae bacterium]|nr:tRNA1(Val) (adenine(37)-N6)-methyltransferase [Lachnospiraceae bacterium]
MNQKKIDLKENERLDDLLLKGYQIIQNPDSFCFGVDAVLLSDFVKIKKEERVLDLGTGNGILPILLAGKTEAQQITGLEIQEESVNLARRSVCYNDLDERIAIVQGDIKKAGQYFEPGFFDVIVSNPPYMLANQGQKNSSVQKTIARHEILCTIDDILRVSKGLLLDRKGRFYMIHRPFRLGEIIAKMHHHKIEVKGLQFVYPAINKEPTMVLIEGLRGGKAGLVVLPPMIMYE